MLQNKSATLFLLRKRCSPGKGALYWLGYQDTKNSIDNLKAYLEME